MRYNTYVSCDWQLCHCFWCSNIRKQLYSFVEYSSQISSLQSTQVAMYTASPVVSPGGGTFQQSAPCTIIKTSGSMEWRVNGMTSSADAVW